MKVFIVGKALFDRTMSHQGITNDNVESKTKTFLISINDTHGTPEVPYFENKSNVKVMFFDDIERDIYHKTYGDIKAFSKEQARELVEFIDRHKDKEKCIVHCAAGISRSGAVGTFINDYYGGDLEEFNRTNPHICPNALVFRLLKQAYGEMLNEQESKTN